MSDKPISVEKLKDKVYRDAYEFLENVDPEWLDILKTMVFEDRLSLGRIISMIEIELGETEPRMQHKFARIAEGLVKQRGKEDAEQGR